MTLRVEVFIMESEDALTTWVRAEDEDGNVVVSRELTEEEIEDGTVRLYIPTRVPGDISFSAEWYERDDEEIPITASGLGAAGTTSLKLHLGE